MSVFLLLTEQHDGEDQNGRDYYAFRLDADEDYNYGPGYFTSREDAQGWIDRTTADADAKYKAALVEWEEKNAARIDVLAKHKAAQDELRAYAKKLGTTFIGSSRGPYPPIKPNRRDFGKTYAIIEMEKEGTE